ncbi:hypothetical protein HDU76_003556, partial [Blyttiomyces sp. JEL0837]
HYSYPSSAAILSAGDDEAEDPKAIEPVDLPGSSSENVKQPAKTGTALLSAGLSLPNDPKSAGTEKEEETLLSALQELFLRISSQKKRTGTVAPSQFVQKLKKENAEILSRHKKEFSEKRKLAASLREPNTKAVKGDTSPTGQEDNSNPTKPPESKKKPAAATWVHELFEGQLTNETKCLTCETITSKEEAFLDLSVDIEHHSSLSTCLRNFSTSETLCSLRKPTRGREENEDKEASKYSGDTFKTIQVSGETSTVHKIAMARCISNGTSSLQHVINTKIPKTDDAEDGDRLYSLVAVIVHIGNGPYHGHYVALVKSCDQWVLFDDESVEPVDEAELQRYFGDQNAPGTGYILLYEHDGFDAAELINSMKSGTESTPPPANAPANAAANGTITNESVPLNTTTTTTTTTKPVTSVEAAPTETNGAGTPGQGWADRRGSKKRGGDKRPSLSSLTDSGAHNGTPVQDNNQNGEAVQTSREGWGWFGTNKRTK